MSNILEVQFRKFKDGEIIAVFPYQIESNNNVLCYSHDGQHSSTIWNINAFTSDAKPGEYKDLLDELKSIGYENLKVIPRRYHYKYLDALKAKFDGQRNKTRFLDCSDDDLKEELLRRGYAIGCLWHIDQLSDIIEELKDEGDLNEDFEMKKADRIVFLNSLALNFDWSDFRVALINELTKD